MPTHLPYWYHEFVYTNTIYIYWTTFKFIHTPDNAHLFYIIVLYYCVSHISVFFSIDKIKIFIIIIIYELIASGWCIHVSGIVLGIRYDNGMSSDRGWVIFLINGNLLFGIFWYQNLCRFMVGMLSFCYQFEFAIVGLLSVTIPALC